MKFSIILTILLLTGNVLYPQSFRDFAKTPPMGWNSYDSYGLCIDEDQTMANAEYLAKNLKKYGWEYVVIDGRWFQPNNYPGYSYIDHDTVRVRMDYALDGYGRLVPHINKFPSAADGRGFATLIEQLHKKGLKFGLHLMRGIPKNAVIKKQPIEGMDGITVDMITTMKNACGWSYDNYEIDMNAKGAQEYYNSVINLYASWGVDFIKIDDFGLPYFGKEIEMVRAAINQCGRDIVLSISPGEVPVSAGEHVSSNANMWRMVGDLWDVWGHLHHLMQVAPKWAKYTGNGAWADCDMIPLGKLAISQHPANGPERMCRLTKDEQYMLMSLFAISRSPMMFGGSLVEMDSFTLSLLTNKNILKMHGESENNRTIEASKQKVVWVADHKKSKNKYLVLFNISDTDQEFNINLDDIGVEKSYRLVNLWTGVKHSKATANISKKLKPHTGLVYMVNL